MIFPGTSAHQSRSHQTLDELDCVSTAGTGSLPLLVQPNRNAKESLHERSGRLQHSTVRQLPREASRSGSTCVFEADPSGIAAEQFRLMQRRLVNGRPEGGSILLTSPGAEDGKSLNSRNLAWALAEAGRDTVLLECDFRRPVQVKQLRSLPTPGMVDVLSGTETPDAVVRRIGDIPLFFIGLQRPADDPINLLRSEALEQLIHWARQNFTWVVIDAPPILPVADVEELLPHADLVVMIVRERVTPQAMLERAAERLGGRLDFVIFNDVALSPSYGYGYHYK